MVVTNDLAQGQPVRNEGCTHDLSATDRKTENDDSSKESETAGRIALVFSVLDSSRKLIISTVIFVAIALGVSVIAKATLSRVVLIEPISVPKELADRGFTGNAAAHFIVDELMILTASAETLMQLGTVGTLGTEVATPKIEIPGTGISIDTIVYYLRGLLGRSDMKITGEITIDAPKLDKAAEKDGKQSLPKFNLRLRIADKGFVYKESDSADDVRILFERAALRLLEQINPYIAGVTYLQKKEFIAAIRMAELQLRNDANDDQAWAYNLLGRVAEDQKRTEIAKDEFSKLSRRFPRFPLSQYNLAHILIGEGSYQKAILAALEGVRIDRESKRRAIGLNNAGAAFDMMRKNRIAFDRHEESAAGILQAVGEFLESDEKTILQRLQAGEVPDARLAIALFRAATNANPMHALAYRTWGDIERERGNFTASAFLFEKSIASAPKDHVAYVGLGRALGESGKFDEAIVQFDAALKISPRYAWSHLYWAQTLARKAEREPVRNAEITRRRAKEHLEAAKMLLPDSTRLGFQVAEIYETLGDTTPASSR